MRRFALSMALALAGLLAPLQAEARDGRKVIVPIPPRPLALPDLKVTSVAEAGTSAVVTIANRGGRAAGPEVVRLRVFERGRLIGTYSALAPAIPAGMSRTVIIRTDLRLTRPGRVLAVQADATHAVFERHERNNTFVVVTRPVPFALPLPLVAR